MLEKVSLEKVLFLDIETVPQTYQFPDLEEDAKHLFELKTRFQQNEDKSFEQLYNEKASILSEFGKIVCISVGFVRETTTGKQLRMKSFYHDDEETLLNQFKKLLDEHYNTPYQDLFFYDNFLSWNFFPFKSSFQIQLKSLFECSSLPKCCPKMAVN